MPSRFKVVVKPSAEKALDRLHPEARTRVLKALRALADDPRPFGAIKLKGEPLYRIRVGEYRVLYDIRDDVLLVLVVRIGPRGSVYDRM